MKTSRLVIYWLIIVSTFILPLILSLPDVQAQELLPVRLKRVIDGDTYEVLVQGKSRIVRLIGVDCAESKPNRKAKKDANREGLAIDSVVALGILATKHVESFLSVGDTLFFEPDVQERDRYGRLLGYFYLCDGKMLNEELLISGYARLYTVPPNIRYMDRFRKVLLDHHVME
jgi:micrococcal nuclease